MSQANKTNHDGVAALSGVPQKSQFVSDWIRKDGLEYETLTPPDQFLAQRRKHSCGPIGIDLKFTGGTVGIEKSQRGFPQIHLIKCRLTGAIRSSQSDDDRPSVEL